MEVKFPVFHKCYLWGVKIKEMPLFSIKGDLAYYNFPQAIIFYL